MAKLKTGTTIGGSTVWHASNDGSGSGLDADLLDGQQGSYYTSYTDTAIANLVASAPGTLDTLNELAAALGDDPNFATTVTNSIATKLNASDYTAADVLSKIKTVDGSGSGLDADTVDGLQASSFLRSDASDTTTGSITLSTVGAYLGYNTSYNYKPYTTGGVGTRSELVSNANMLLHADADGSGTAEWLMLRAGAGTANELKIISKTSGAAQDNNALQFNGSTVWNAGNDGSGSGLDADLLDGQHGSYYLPASSYTAADVLTKIKTVDGSGSGLDADLLDGQQGSAYLLKSGGTMTGTIDMGSANNIGYRFNGRSFSWNSSMQTPTSYVPHIMQQTYTGWDPIMGIKTTNGFWQFGAYSSDTIHFGYMGGAFGSHGTNAFDQQFWFNKDGSFVASGDITAYSDERLKSEVVTIPNALDTVSKLRGVNYIKDDKASTGVIAQEVEAVMPEVVHTADDEMGTKSVAYGNMVGVLIEAVKELKAELEAVKADNAELRKLIDK